MSDALRICSIAAALGVACTPSLAFAAEADPLPRSAFFGHPERSNAQLSPDGRHLAWLAPRDGVLNLFVARTTDLPAAKPVTDDRGRGINQYVWAHTSRHILYLQDEGGDENWVLHSVHIGTAREAVLTPERGVQAQVVGVSPRKPYSVLVALNDRTPEWHDVYEIDIRTGRRKIVEKNLQQFAGFKANQDLLPRVAWKRTPAGGELYRRTKSNWQRILSYGQEDSRTTQVLAVEASGDSALMLSSRGRDKAALVRLDLLTGAETVLAENERADIDAVWLHPRTNDPQAWRASYLKYEYGPLSPPHALDLERLVGQSGARVTVASRTLDDSKWIAVVDDPLSPPATYLYDRVSGRKQKLFDERPQLRGAPLAAMQAIELRARDGLPLVSYLTIPAGADSDGDGLPDAPLPLVLKVHGGPWWRDTYGFNVQHQWLANRGYAVLSVNFRGSLGFGKQFTNAGDKEWGGRMHTDLLDALSWAIEHKITTSEKVAIYGASYGGYAALVGMTFTPERFACGVSIVGPSNLSTLFSSIPPYWQSFIDDFARRVGDWRTEEGRKLLEHRSPLFLVGNIRRPLLIGQGANDPRVKQAESDQIVKAMKSKNLPVTYALYPDEGHGFIRPENVISFYAITEGFFANCLGGQRQPVGNDLVGSSLQVLEGAEYVPGLAEALQGR